MNLKSFVGELGENLATKYLISKNCEILYRNYLKPWGELDIVCRTTDGTLVFVEVKTLRQAFPDAAIKELAPEENLTKAKLLKLQRTAEMFAGNHSELVNEERGWRIDLLAIKIFPDNTHQIAHYENI